MDLGTEFWRYFHPSLSHQVDSQPEDDKKYIANRRLIQNLSTAVLNTLSPMAKASLVGLGLDFLPYLLVTRLKLSQSLNWVDIVKLISSFHSDISSGALMQRIFKNYPKKNSWLTTFLFSVVVYQITVPISNSNLSKNKTENALYSTKLDSTETQKESVSDAVEEVSEPHLDSIINRTEFETILKNFMASLASTSVGLWLLRKSIAPEISSRKKGNHVSLALYAFIQASHALWVFQRLRTKALGNPWQIKTPWFNLNLNVYEKITEVCLFGLSSYQVMISWFFYPQNLPASYERWIARFSEIDMSLLKYLRALWRGTVVEGKHSDFLFDLCRKKGLDTRLGDPYYGVPSCQLIHLVPGESCPQDVLRRFSRTFLKAFISVYLPLNLFAYIMKRNSKRETEETKPKKNQIQNLFERVLYPSIRSSAFLGTFVATIFSSVCLIRSKYNTDKYGAVLGSMLCGFSSILVEKTSRRLNLTLYLIPRALDTIYQGALIRHISPNYIENPLFAVSLATLLTCYRMQPSSVQPPVRALLNWVFSSYPVLPVPHANS